MALAVGAVVETDVLHVELVAHLALSIPGRSIFAVFTTEPLPFLTIFELPLFNRFGIPHELALAALCSVAVSLLLPSRLGFGVGVGRFVD